MRTLIVLISLLLISSQSYSMQIKDLLNPISPDSPITIPEHFYMANQPTLLNLSSKKKLTKEFLFCSCCTICKTLQYSTNLESDLRNSFNHHVEKKHPIIKPVLIVKKAKWDGKTMPQKLYNGTQLKIKKNDRYYLITHSNFSKPQQ